VNEKINSYVSAYKEQIRKGEIQDVYSFLLKYVMRVKASLEKSFPKEYSFGNIFPGYLDFSYFYFFNSYLRDKKLRFGIVLNHSEMRFELWLLGQNKGIREKYWDILRTSPWNRGRKTMPTYSVLETVLVADPDFDNLDTLTADIEKRAANEVDAIVTYLKNCTS